MVIHPNGLGICLEYATNQTNIRAQRKFSKIEESEKNAKDGEVS